MSERTHPDARIPHEVQTRLADVREFRNELVAAANSGRTQHPEDYIHLAEHDLVDVAATRHALPRVVEHTPTQEELDAQLTNLLGVIADDELPTSHIPLPAHGYDEHVATRMRQIPDASSLSAWDAASLTNMLDLALGAPVDPEKAHVPRPSAPPPAVIVPAPRYEAYPNPLDEPISPQSFDRPDQEVVMERAPYGADVYIGADHTPVPVEPVHTPVPPAMERRTTVREASATGSVSRKKPGSRMSATAFMVLCAVGAANAGLMAGLYLNHDADETVSQVDEAPVSASPAEPAEAAASPRPAGAPSAASSAATAPAAVESPEAATAEPPEPADDPLVTAREAIDAADPQQAGEALERARRSGADPAFLNRLQAELLVLRGDGAAAVPDLRTMTDSNSDDAMVWAALGRALAQAERDTEAERAFNRALELDERDVNALVGIARLKTRAANIGGARARLRTARQAYEASDPNPTLEARLFTAEGAIEFELGDFDEATAHAERALGLDERSAEAHLLLARIALEQHDSSATDQLRAAVAGRAPPAEAIGLLVPHVSGDEACSLADRYLVIAPHGYDLREVQRAEQRCR